MVFAPPFSGFYNVLIRCSHRLFTCPRALDPCRDPVTERTHTHTQTPTSQNITIMRSKNLQFCAFFTRCYTTCISACNVARVLHFLCTHHAHVMHMWFTSRVSSANHMTHHMIHHLFHSKKKSSVYHLLT